MNPIMELEKIAAKTTKRRRDYIFDSFYLLVRALTIADIMEAQNPGCLTKLGIDKEIEHIRKAVESMRETEFSRREDKA